MGSPLYREQIIIGTLLLLEIYYTHYREVIRSRRFETTSWLPDVISLEVIAQKHEPNPFGFELGLLAKASYQGHGCTRVSGERVMKDPTPSFSVSDSGNFVHMYTYTFCLYKQQYFWEVLCKVLLVFDVNA